MHVFKCVFGPMSIQACLSSFLLSQCLCVSLYECGPERQREEGCHPGEVSGWHQGAMPGKVPTWWSPRWGRCAGRSPRGSSSGKTAGKMNCRTATSSCLRSRSSLHLEATPQRPATQRQQIDLNLKYRFQKGSWSNRGPSQYLSYITKRFN